MPAPGAGGARLGRGLRRGRVWNLRGAGAGRLSASPPRPPRGGGGHGLLGLIQVRRGGRGRLGCLSCCLSCCCPCRRWSRGRGPHPTPPRRGGGGQNEAGQAYVMPPCVLRPRPGRARPTPGLRGWALSLRSRLCGCWSPDHLPPAPPVCPGCSQLADLPYLTCAVSSDCSRCLPGDVCKHGSEWTRQIAEVFSFLLLYPLRIKSKLM